MLEEKIKNKTDELNNKQSMINLFKLLVKIDRRNNPEDYCVKNKEKNPNNNNPP